MGLDPNLNCSVPPVTTPTVSAAMKAIPVLVSPVLAIAGAEALPSGKKSGLATVALVPSKVKLALPAKLPDELYWTCVLLPPGVVMVEDANWLVTWKLVPS